MSVLTPSPSGGPPNATFSPMQILEHTLGFLPMKDLLLAMRVSKTWRHVITKSAKLQQSLFYQPVGPTHRWQCRFHTIWEQVVLTKVRGDTEPHHKSYPVDVMDHGRVNPLVASRNPKPTEHITCRAQQGGAELIDLLIPFQMFGTLLTPSWRTMHITQPPLRRIAKVICDVQRWEHGDWSDLEVTVEGELPDKPDGYTCHDVVERIKSLLVGRYGPLKWHAVSIVGELILLPSPAEEEELVHFNGRPWLPLETSEAKDDDYDGDEEDRSPISQAEDL